MGATKCKSKFYNSACLLAVKSAQGISQVVGSFDGEPTKFRNWIKSTQKYVSLAGGHDNQSKKLAVHDYIQRYMVKYPENS